VILQKRWECANQCGSTAQTGDDKTPMHPCKNMAGLMAPLVLLGTKAKVEAVERQDFIGREQVQTDANGRPVMAVVTTRDDGQDCTVFAPTAHGKKER
jgi:hypothetical protein